MSLLDAISLIKNQRTVRNYGDRVPDTALIDKCIALAQRSPSTSNHQPYCVLKLEDAELRKKVLAEMVCQPYVFKAPVLLLVCVDWSRQDMLAQEIGVTNEINKISKLIVGISDASIFCHSLVLACQASGLAVSYIASPYTAMKEVANLLEIPLNKAMPLHMLSIGFADEDPPGGPRYPFDSIVHINKFRVPNRKMISEYFNNGSKELEKRNYFEITGDQISSWREHYRIKFGRIANERTWGPLEEDIRYFFESEK
ncbi:MAG: nitroreductase family protein [Proteobacteria bacterium]|jgi:nitroreductase|nr:nitroreductase family protein [Pseudomonadota bacterium]